MNRHLLDNVLNMESLLDFKFPEDIDFLHDFYDNFPFPEISLSDNSIEGFSVGYKASFSSPDTDVGSSFRVVQHGYLTRYLSLHN